MADNTAKYLHKSKHGTLSLRKSTVWDEADMNGERGTKTLFIVRFKLSSEALERMKELGISQRDALKANPSLLLTDGTGLGRFVSNGTEKITTYYRGEDLNAAILIFENVKQHLLRGVKPTKTQALKKRVISVQPSTVNRTSPIVVSLPVPISGEERKIRPSSMRKGMSHKDRKAYYAASQEKSVPVFNPMVSKKLSFSVR